MKTLLTGLLLLASLGATAGQVEVYTATPGAWGTKTIEYIRYAVNAPLGRAAIKFDVCEFKVDEDDCKRKVAVVPGLYFNNSTGDIVLEENGSLTVCATTKQRRRTLKIRPTGDCVLKSNKVKVSVDDGFRVRTRTNSVLTITTSR